METWDAIRNRASVRDYLPKPIDPKLLERLVEAGSRAPSARALEPWEFIVITKPEILKQIGRIIATGRFLREAPAAIAVICKPVKYYLEDGCAATENILLAATDAGLGACWIAGDKKEYCEEALKILGVPEEFKLVSLISLGWPAAEVPQSKTRALSDVIHWEKFRG